jgi:trans-aconitate 2-methyltransferase
MWDPAQYLHFADERSRPFYDLTGRIAATAPAYVVDLGCGPGQLTASLSARWPAAEILGIDSSAAMIETAQAAGYSGTGAGARLSFAVGDVTDWQPERPVDVIVSNAVLQWVPGHLDLLPRWSGFLADDGWIAFQVPGNLDQPVHALLRELAASSEWRGKLGGIELNRQAGDPADYLDRLAGLGLSVDAWETTYLHVLPGEDPVTDWYSGTGMRPALAALDAADAAEFTRQYSERIRKIYPAQPFGTVLPFRRVFVVARKA